MTPVATPCLARCDVPPRRAAGRVRGVTLLELLVVLSIMGLVAALVCRCWAAGVSTHRAQERRAADGRGAAARAQRGASPRDTRLVLLDLERRAFRVDTDPRETRCRATSS